MGLLLIGLALVGADEAPAKDAVPADEAPAADAAPAEAAPAEAAAAAVSTGSIMDKVKNTKAPKVVGGGYRPESAYTSTASYGAPHFLIMCIMLVFLAAGCKEAYDRYGNKDAYKKKKKKHDTIGGYGAVNKEDESDEEAPSLMGDLKGLVGGGAGKLGSGVGGVTGGMSKGVGIFTAVAKNMTSDLQKAGLAAADKAKSGVSDAVNVSAHLEKAKAAASVVGNVASAAAEDAKKGAEAGLSKGLDTARSAADVSAHLEKAKAAASVVGNVASAAAEDAKKGAEAGISKGLDTARSASDVSAHLEKAKAAATLATNVASSAVNDAAKASQEAASAGLNAAKDGVGKVGSVAGDGAALLSARSEISEGKAENTMKFDKSAVCSPPFQQPPDKLAQNR